MDKEDLEEWDYSGTKWGKSSCLQKCEFTLKWAKKDKWHIAHIYKRAKKLTAKR